MDPRKFKSLFQRLLPIGVLIAAAVVAACSTNTKTKGGGKKPSGESQDGEADDGPSPVTPGASEAGGDGPAPEGENDAPDDNGDDGDDGETAAGPTLEQIVEECGGKDLAEADPNKIIYEKNLTSLPVVKNVLGIVVTAETKLAIKVTGKSTDQDATVTITKVEGLLAELAKGVAEKQAKDNSGKATLTNVPFSEYGELSKNKIYEKVVCTFVPATAINNQRGGKKTLVTFDPPLPASVSPRASAARYAAEIGKGRTFDGIEAKISESDNPDLTGKTKVKGKVTVTKVEPKADVDDGKGGKLEIKADIAFKITFDFESPKVTFALGLPPVVTYYISHEKKDLVANTVDTTDAGGGVAVFLHK